MLCFYDPIEFFWCSSRHCNGPVDDGAWGFACQGRNHSCEELAPNPLEFAPAAFTACPIFRATQSRSECPRDFLVAVHVRVAQHCPELPPSAPPPKKKHTHVLQTDGRPACSPRPKQLRGIPRAPAPGS